jgi:UDP-N-acetylmuramate dehydrogenase
MPIFAGLEHFVREQEPLAPCTWLRLGGPAEFFAEPTSVEELTTLVRRCQEAGMPIRVLGGGSNVLIRDEGVPGVVVLPSAAAFAQISIQGRKIVAGGGAKLGHVISAAVREGLGGLEGLVGIPGTVGGALHTNAGTHGGDIGQWTQSVTVLTRAGETITRPRSELRFGYLSSNVDELMILETSLELEPGDARHLTKQMQQAWILKRAEQPLSDQRTAVLFKSPGGVSAASLIQDAGLARTQVGEASLSERNANFVVVGPKATSRDVLALVDTLRHGVMDRIGAQLDLALEIW